MHICRLDWDFEAFANQLNELVLGKIKILLLQALEYTQSKILLLCDISGSRSGAMNDLRNAVITFARDKDEKEDISGFYFIDANGKLGSEHGTFNR